MSATRPSLPRQCGIAVLALATAAGPARAQVPTPRPAGREEAQPREVASPAVRDVLAVLPIEVVGKLAEHIPRALEDRLAAGLQRGEATVVTADAVRARLPAGGCAGDCLRDAAIEAGATHLMRATITVEGRDYNIQVVLVRADTGEQVATSSELCEICGHEELGDRIDDLAGAIRRKISAAVAPPPRLRVVARPDGSVVTVDGEVVGVTPLDVAVAAGEHDVVVHKRGFITHRRRVAFVDGVVETIDAELGPVPVEAPAPAPSRRARYAAPLGWSSIALGLGATAGGVALVALDEQPIRSDCAGANVDADGHCKWRYDTLAGGVVLTIAGVAAVVLGAIVVALDRQRGKRSRAQTTAWAQGAGFGLRF